MAKSIRSFLTYAGSWLAGPWVIVAVCICLAVWLYVDPHAFSREESYRSPRCA
ncbi:MAG: hypothetical protein JOY90_01905 [Bradyrhizobium sp.]|uniref:hypothetical protein n=1 Tax=Bradyrhizobium sp. TaxID=376 RepID=UPI001D81F1C2|nr:hypothetical protein [Bradyrhizobium sp.]MBV9559208.1 hypothetical protein [Bradyrhizobium sp.]